MALKEMKGDNIGAWLAASATGAMVITMYVPAPWFVPVWFRLVSAFVVCALVFGDVALAWYLRDDFTKWWGWHQRRARKVAAWWRRHLARDARADRSQARYVAQEARAVRGTAHELIACALDDQRGRARAKDILRDAIDKASPTDTDAAKPRVVEWVKETATGVAVLAHLSPVANAPKLLAGIANGVEYRLDAPDGSLTIRKAGDDRPGHHVIFDFALRSLAKPEPVPVGLDLERDGLVIGTNAYSGEVVRAPMEGHVLIAGTTGSGKSTTEKVIVEEIAASATPAHTVFLDPTGGMPTVGRVANVRIVGQEECRDWLRHVGWAEYERRAAMLDELGDAERLGPEHAPWLVIVIDELPELPDSCDTKKEADEFWKMFTRLARNARKYRIKIVVALQKATKDTAPTKFTNLFRTKIYQALTLDESRHLLGPHHVDKRMDLSTLATGEAVVFLPDSGYPKRVKIAPPSGWTRAEAGSPPVAPRPAPPTRPELSDELSDDLSEEVSDELSVPSEQGVRGGAGEAADSSDSSALKWTLLEVLLLAGEPLDAEQIGDRIGKARSTVHPVLQELVADGLARKGTAGRRAVYELAVVRDGEAA